MSRVSQESESDRQIELSRVFDAPRELVWRVWTTPEHIVRWWGPRGFTNTSHAMDVRPGGQWRFVMHGPDGRDYENLITYLEVVEPERLVYKHGGDVDTEPVDFRVTVRFDRDAGNPGRTRVSLRMEFPTKEARDFVVREYGAIEGGQQTLQRLGEYLAGAAAGSGATGRARPFIISRVFRAPRERVFRAWTERGHLQRWFGPPGTTIPECTLDLRAGGAFHYLVRSGEGSDMWARWVFRDVVPGERLVFVVSFSDRSGGVARAPFDESWPLEMLSTVTFDDHAGIGRGTVVGIRWEPLGAGEVEERTFDRGHESMNQGWAGTLDRLAEHLSTP